MEQASLFTQLGIDWKLLLSQVVNFAILLAVLTQFVYKPLLKVIKKRNERIQEGLDKADEADVRLKEVDGIAKAHLQKADQESIAIIKATESRAKSLEESLVKKAEEKQAMLLAQAQAQYEKQQEESRNKVLAEASALVKRLIVKTVELKPEAIDQALIEKAINAVKNEPR
jgi:F-type H+-transporting ATPase subunit b